MLSSPLASPSVRPLRSLTPSLARQEFAKCFTWKVEGREISRGFYGGGLGVGAGMGGGGGGFSELCRVEERERDKHTTERNIKTECNEEKERRVYIHMHIYVYTHIYTHIKRSTR